MENRTSISVVIPTYNRSKDLIIAIQSVLNQSYPVYEILVCDDGSTDNSKQEVLKLNSPIIKWIDCGKNGRPAIPRNIGIKNSHSEWVAFLDSDDIWLPNKIEAQLKYALVNGYSAVSSNAIRVRANHPKENYLFYSNYEINFDTLLKSNYVICSSMIVKTSVLKSVNAFPESDAFKAIEDYFLWLKIATIYPIGYIAEPLLEYIDIPNQSIRSNSRTVKEQRQLIFSELIKWISTSTIANKEEMRLLVEDELGVNNRSNFSLIISRIKNQLRRIVKG